MSAALSMGDFPSPLVAVSSTLPAIACREALASELSQWFVLRTKSRQEKVLASELSQRGIECFLPLARQVRYHGKESVRRVLVEEPLLPGYLFVRGEVDDAYQADRSRRTAQLIKVADQDKLAWELKNLREAVERGVPLLPYAHFIVGTRVEVRAGPLRGIQGVVDVHKGNRLILQITALGQALSLEIDGSLLDRLETASLLPSALTAH